ncbi:VOC family protein [Archangium lansingense]|uniref:VOC family protein n=1 Tax=Archangium lansingense TaxID=2995310 RepID=A0ABT4AJI4_9BACT|nr:VOC family protein [Archangium lansinium]MCY1081837.1 VOC family protein [Archangium lansinium]
MAMKKAKKAAEKIRTAAKKVAKKVSTKMAAKKATAKKARAKAQPIPKGYHILTPSIVVKGAKEAVEFYKKAFGAKEVGKAMTTPDGQILHGEFRIGDSIVMYSDEFPNMGSRSPLSVGGTSSSLLIYTRDADALYKQALAAGAKVAMPIADMFWGDRYGVVVDPFGHQWQIATHKEDLTPKEMARRAAAAMSAPPPAPPAPEASSTPTA